MDHNRKTITIAFLAYNQEKFVREAVRSVLSQVTECPAQIIISDDCSTDATYAILQEEVRAHAGFHEVLLRRNEENLGIGAHVQEIIDLAEGDLVIMAAGDDISLPHRAQFMLDAWLQLGEPDGLFSDAHTIDANSKYLTNLSSEWTSRYKQMLQELPDWSVLDYMSNNGKLVTLGATSAWSKSVCRDFPRIAKDVVNEDDVFTFRAGLGRGIRYLDTPLVQRRVHDANAWTWDQRQMSKYSRALRRLENTKFVLPLKLAVLNQSIRDVDHCMCHAKMDHSTLLQVKEMLEQRLVEKEIAYAKVCGTYSTRVQAFMKRPKVVNFLALFPRFLEIRIRALVACFSSKRV